MNRYVRRATADMYRNNRQDIRCPCRKCKLQALFTPSSETIRDHLLMRGFMDGHTQWMSSDDDEDDEDDDDEEFGGNDEEEGHQQQNSDHGEEGTAAEDDEHQHQGEQHVQEDAQEYTPLTAAVRDPHVQEVLMDKMTTTDARADLRRTSKLAQLEIDSNTPLYDPARGPEESRLRVSLDILKMKTDHGWSDTSIDDLLQYSEKAPS